VAVPLDSTTGTWATDTLRPGSYRLIASVPARPNCQTARVTREITVTPTQILVAGTPGGVVEVYPRNCVVLMITTRFSGGTPGRITYTVSGLDFNRTEEVPRNRIIRAVVPIGQVTVVIRPQYCADYRDSFVIRNDSSFTRSLLCGPGG
jgi:hypothetical protein